MNILGLSAFYHDSAACLLQEGRVVAAAQEERFSRIKHDEAFPTQAVRSCLELGGIHAGDLDAVVFYDKPILKFDRLLETYLAEAPRGYRMFHLGLPVWVRQKLHMTRELDRGLEGQYRGRFMYVEHHQSHAASAFFPSPFEEAAILTLDGVGEWATGSIAHGRGSQLEMLAEHRFPHSLGLLYSALTYFCGFKVNGGEYKLMGLAPYGVPRFADTLREKLIDIRADGSFRLNLEYFPFTRREVMTDGALETLLGLKRRTPESELTQPYMDLAASIQQVTEEVVLLSAQEALRLTGAKRLVLAGGVALNCVANGKLLRSGIVDDLWVQPAAGDCGGALGAALFAWHQLLEQPRKVQVPDSQRGSLLGERVDPEQAERLLVSEGEAYERISDPELRYERIAELLEQGAIVGHAAGPMEFGPRALGCRSILADPRAVETQSKVNLKIKFRESFRPFAPAVLKEHAVDWFELEAARDSPYMLIVADVLEKRRGTRSAAADAGASGLERLGRVGGDVPAVTHVDGSARVQTVDERHRELQGILRAFHGRTGCPVLLNTSFNVRGEPIVRTAADALRCFRATHMDVLVVGECIVLKGARAPEQSAVASQARPSSGLVRIDFDPSIKKLRQFGWLALGVLGLFGSALSFSWGPFAGEVATEWELRLGRLLLTLGVAAGVASLVRPALNRWLFVGLSCLSYPIGWLVSQLSLRLLFFGLISPAGWIRRTFGRDVFERQLAPGESGWRKSVEHREPESYFRQS